VSSEVELPSTLSHRYVRSILGFGLAVGVGLAPFLGKIPGVDALLNLLPRSSRGALIILSTFLMGFIAAVIQFYSAEFLTRRLIRRRFLIAGASLVTGFFLLFVFHSFFVTEVPIKNAKETVPEILGAQRVQGEPCDCPPKIPDKLCAQRLGIGNEAAIETCWDPGSILHRRLLLHSSYLIVMGSFGALIGLLLLQGEARKIQKRRPRKAAVPPPTPAPPHGTS
jgi:phosphate/sulfate permease